MKLKTLLLGSAAALIAVTGARAADAVVAEPENVDYVRVCDLYGAGFFYIPGTETCLGFSGYVRTDITFNDNDEAEDTSRWDYRVRMNVDARNETDLGTLRSQIRFQADGNGGFNALGFQQTGGAAVAGSVAQGDAFVGIDRALISLGGFRTGYSDSYTTTVHGYGNPVEKYDGYYGYDQSIFADYTFEVAGFAATVGVQDSVGPTAAAGNNVNLDYYGGVAYSSDLFDVAATYIYEDVADEGAYKVSLGVKPLDGLFLKGWFVGDDGGDTYSVEGTGDYAWGVGASYAVLDNVAVYAAYTDVDEGAEAFTTIGMRYDPVPGLSMRPEVQLREDTGQSYSLRLYRNW
ncbi:porin [Rhizobiaceae bacterium]|nr:porin [Rhizobiaceae bacterium]